jgi:dihydroorotate dehydrogenase electron transfer subunit
MPPRIFDSTIVASEPVMGDSKLITLTVPVELARDARAGHFVNVLCRGEGTFDPLLRRPFSVMRANAERSSVEILVRPFGRGSAWLDSQKIGTVVDVMGLHGNTYTINPGAQNLLLVAGGVGAAPLVMLSEEAIQRGLNVTYLMGSATEEGLLPASQLPDSVEYVVATDDGSRGYHGFVTDLVPNYARWADQVFTCGPEPMFRALRSSLGPHRLGGKPTVQVSMERSMACGVGACLGCVVETKRGMSPSCLEGPVYDMDVVQWS